MSSLFKNSWKYLGIILLLYVFSMVFLVPMGPGLESSHYSEEGAQTVVTVEGYATHFEARCCSSNLSKEVHVSLQTLKS